MKAIMKVMLLFVLGSILIFNSCKEDETTIASAEITSISPESAGEGSIITISGKNFVTDTSKIEITIGGVEAVIDSVTSTFIDVIVPKGVKLGSSEIVVKINGTVVENSTAITIINNPFTITGFSKKTGKVAAKIKILGTNLNATDFKVVMNNGSEKLVKQKILSAAEDGSSIEIELAPKTFSGKFEITRVSDNVMVKSAAFTYELTYNEAELVLDKPGDGVFNDLFYANGNIYVAATSASGILVYNNKFENINTLSGSGISYNFYTVLVRKSGDIYFTLSNDMYLYKVDGNDFSAVHTFNSSDYRKIAESKDESFLLVLMVKELYIRRKIQLLIISFHCRK
ncbi:MAG: IPT/TIG domain-containing protein [Bacteroidales bacterium]|nr:IPT/TIG domain-containing protein [Bacteroidales bacterium]